MDDFPHKLREARNRLGMSQARFAEALGASQGSVSKWEAGREKPNASMLASISMLTGKPADHFMQSYSEFHKEVIGWPNFPKVVGTVEGAFVAEPNWKDALKKSLIIPVPEQLFMADLEGYVVIGNRANRKFQNGDVVFVARSSDYKYELKNDDIVLVRRFDDAENVELSLRRYSRSEPAWLWPLTDDPEYQEPLKLGSSSLTKADPDIMGIVVASYHLHPIAYRSIMPKGHSF